ncbi:uncharacterized protein LOC123691439 [Colias croceus]|uniref:uncharacterized protein LOC123691439 n=1 Tax=Colias crocea TaxID=72248 RepID=UPI001E27A8F5|nr:uncharacterized protein LOC123691439 [Colias croceus]
MGNSTSAQENEPAPAPGPAKTHESLGKFYAAEIEELRQKPCCRNFLKILFVILGLITIIQSIVVIAVTIASAIASKIFSKEQSGRLVAMIILAVTAAITISMVIYAIIAVFKNKKKPLHATAAVMLIMSIIQAVILGVCVRVSPEDEILLNRSLVESFRLAREDNPRHVKIWATMQSDLNCCGVYSADDYRIRNIPSYFAPDIPISCCPGYDPKRSELVQERERESCKARREYYEAGCKSPMMEMFKFGCTMVLVNASLLILSKLLLALVALLLLRQKPKEEQQLTVVTAPTPMPRASLSQGKTKSISTSNAL